MGFVAAEGVTVLGEGDLLSVLVSTRKLTVGTAGEVSMVDIEGELSEGVTLGASFSALGVLVRGTGSSMLGGLRSRLGVAGRFEAAGPFVGGDPALEMFDRLRVVIVVRCCFT